MPFATFFALAGSLLHDGASMLDERASALTEKSNIDTIKEHIDSAGAAVRDTLPDKDTAQEKLESAYDNAKAAVVDAKGFRFAKIHFTNAPTCF